jgi:hypothetical protein
MSLRVGISTFAGLPSGPYTTNCCVWQRVTRRGDQQALRASLLTSPRPCHRSSLRVEGRFNTVTGPLESSVEPGWLPADGGPSLRTPLGHAACGAARRPIPKAGLVRSVGRRAEVAPTGPAMHVPSGPRRDMCGIVRRSTAHKVSNRPGPARPTRPGLSPGPS